MLYIKISGSASIAEHENVSVTGPKIDEGPQNTNLGSSNNECNRKDYEDDMLMDDLRASKLENLYEKFLGVGITSDIIWYLDEDILNECDLTKIEKLRYQKAAAQFKEKISN